MGQADVSNCELNEKLVGTGLERAALYLRILEDLIRHGLWQVR